MGVKFLFDFLFGKFSGVIIFAYKLLLYDMKLNYELDNNYVVVRQPIIPKKTKSGLTVSDNAQRDEMQRMVRERGHELLAKGPKADILAEPGDYVLVSPSGFAAATLLTIDGVEAMLLDSIFIVGRIKDASAYKAEDAELEERKKDDNKSIKDRLKKSHILTGEEAKA